MVIIITLKLWGTKKQKGGGIMKDSNALQINDTIKYNAFKSESKKTSSPAVKKGFTNFLYPTTMDKVRALAYSHVYDEDGEDRDYLYSEVENIYAFDPWNVIVYLQSMASDLNEMFLRACRNLLEALKPKNKAKYDYEFAEKVNESEYEFNFTNSSDFKKHPKGKRYKQFDMSYSKDNKPQAGLSNHASKTERVEVAKKSEPSQTQTAETKRTTELTHASAMSLAGKGGCGSGYTWSGGESFFAPTSFADCGGYTMEL